jgi:hypothetical protein
VRGGPCQGAAVVPHTCAHTLGNSTLLMKQWLPALLRHPSWEPFLAVAVHKL